MAVQRLPSSYNAHLRGVIATRERWRQHASFRDTQPLHAVPITADQEAFADALYAAAQPEHVYPRDADKAHAYAMGTSVSLFFGDETHQASVVSRFEFLGRLRYRLAFEHGQFALTEAQIKHLSVSSCTALALYEAPYTALMVI